MFASRKCDKTKSRALSDSAEFESALGVTVICVTGAFTGLLRPRLDAPDPTAIGKTQALPVYLHRRQA
jgi:hypothetical protein